MENNDLSFVQNEFTEIDQGDDCFSEFFLENIPIFKGSLTGVIYQKNNVIQSFEVSENGIFKFSETSNDILAKCIKGDINNLTGELKLIWNLNPGQNYCVVCYDYAKL
jgi:hypothetical protein